MDWVGGCGATPQPKDQMYRRVLLDVVVAQRAVLQLLASEDEALVVGRDAFLVLDLLLHAVDRVRRFHVQSSLLARQGLEEDLGDAAPRRLGWTRRRRVRGLLLDRGAQIAAARVAMRRRGRGPSASNNTRWSRRRQGGRRGCVSAVQERVSNRVVQGDDQRAAAHRQGRKRSASIRTRLYIS